MAVIDLSRVYPGLSLGVVRSISVADLPFVFDCDFGGFSKESCALLLNAVEDLGELFRGPLCVFQILEISHDPPEGLLDSLVGLVVDLKLSTHLIKPP